MKIAIDFDGVISDYRGWKGVGNFYDPVPGARIAIAKLREQGHKIILYTSRGEELALSNWLCSHGITVDYINVSPDNSAENSHKPIADVYIDDRAIRFNGNWQETLDQLGDIEPWWRKEKDCKNTEY